MIAAVVVAVLGMAAFAFGAVYPWAYWPLVGVCAAVGIAGLWRPSTPASAKTAGLMTLPLGLMLAVMLLQLIPLAPQTLSRLSPATHDTLTTINLAYAAGDIPHPLSLQPAATRRAAVVFVGFSIFFLGLTRSLNGPAIRRLTLGLAAVGALLAVVGVVQQATFNGRILGVWQPLNSTGVAAFGPFINRNHFAGWVLLALPLALGYVIAEVTQLEAPDLRRRVLWLATARGHLLMLVAFACALMATALAVTGSRSGFIGLLVLTAVLGAALLRRQPRQRLGLMAFLLLLLAVAVSRAGFEYLSGRFAAAGPSLDGRVFVWEDAWRVHTLFPLFGTGINAYGAAMVTHQQFMPSDVHYAQAHNDYLQILAEGGWVFAIPAVACIAVAAIEIRRRFREGRDGPENYWLRVGAVAGLLAISVQEIAEFSLQMPAIFALFCVNAAVAVRPRPQPSEPRA